MELTPDFSGLFTPQSDELTFESLMDRVQELEEEVAMQSIDRLTGVLSTDQFYAAVRRILQENPEQQFVMWRFDIDKFQTVNNLFGVEEGNRLLIYCAKYLMGNTRRDRSNAIGRIGGDVFCGISPYTEAHMTAGDAGNHWLSASTTLAGMEPFFRGFRDDFRFSVSIGFYQIEDANEPIEIVYSRALAASKACKDNSEKMYAFYDKAISAKIEETQLITAEMHSALENGEFTVYLQPKVRLTDLSLVGAEALVRWIHPKKGKIPPDSFIPIFEENGFITKLDLYVLRRCCAYIQSWMRLGLNPIPLSVNLSQMDLSTPGLPFKIMAVLEEYKVAARYIHLEITESAYADDVEQVNGVTQAFKDLGFHLEMDDFGKGYSSLNMIAELPIDTLKLDMGFLQGEESSSGKVISLVTGLARHMNLVTVAEGIETQEQLAFLRSINCDCGQGYLFSRPLPKADFDAYMRGCAISSMTTKIPHVDKTVSEYKGWNTGEIWSTDSNFSKMFNAFAGGVAVSELNLLTGQFRLARYNDLFVKALHTTHEHLKNRSENLVDLIHPDDFSYISSAVGKINDPKDWDKDTGLTEFDLRMRVLDGEDTGEPRYTWVRVKWKLADFSVDTRTYIILMDDVNEHYDSLENMRHELSTVDELKWELGVLSRSGSAGVVELKMPYGGKIQVLAASEQFLRIHCLDHLIGTATYPMDIEDFLPEEGSEKVIDFWLKTFEAKETRTVWETLITNLDGEEQKAVSHGSVRYEEDAIYADCVVSFHSDSSSLEDALTMTQERARLIQESIEITWVDLVEGTVFFGMDLQHTFGMPATLPLNLKAGFPGTDYFHPDTVTELKKMMEKLSSRGDTVTMELKMRHLNCTEYVVRKATFYSTCGEDGEVIRITGVGRDITQEITSRTPLNVAEISAQMPEGIIVLSFESGKLLFANEPFYKTVGVPQSQMESEFKNLPLQLVSDEETAPVKVIPELAGGEGSFFELEFQLKNFSMRWVMLRGILRGDRIYATIRDITARKRLEVDLDREIWFNEILNSISDELLYQVNIPDQTIQFSGRNAPSFGVSTDPITLTMDAKELDSIVDEYQSTFFEMIREMVGGVESTYTIQMKNTNGIISWYRYEYRIISEDGRPTFAVGKAVNIDYQVDLLSQLERDSLTGCYNAKAMKMRSDQVLSASFPAAGDFTAEKNTEKTHALLLIQLVNLGDLADKITLKEREDLILYIAEMLNGKFRESDLVGRIAEDQFSVFMKKISDGSMALQKISDIYMSFSQLNIVNKSKYQVEVKISCGYASKDGINYVSLMENMQEVPIDIEIE